ncbi:hypothetical protein AK812_SmicGene31465 [Symbiodinium microadriaticum]|uniref:Uncharacterized protein n=1 Tax=Symbiodinium microadriaticum TaxID=2951 RepID=A0A1Q9CWL0_SYMMI|nr:hypothetical protein AK812_SmicGene31465 [Symbiodinium microadriaticum]
MWAGRAQLQPGFVFTGVVAEYGHLDTVELLGIIVVNKASSAAPCFSSASEEVLAILACDAMELEKALGNRLLRVHAERDSIGKAC